MSSHTCCHKVPIIIILPSFSKISSRKIEKLQFFFAFQFSLFEDTQPEHEKKKDPACTEVIASTPHGRLVDCTVQQQ